MIFKNSLVIFKGENKTSEEVFFAWKAINEDDPYGSRIFKLAEDWALLMEKHIKEGYDLTKSLVNDCFKIADFDGVTGYMYHSAVNILTTLWFYGDILSQIYIASSE